MRYASFLLCFFFQFFPPLGRTFFQWVRASAPTGCSPRDSDRLFAIGSDLQNFTLLSCLPQIGGLSFPWVHLCTCGVQSPRFRPSTKLSLVDFFIAFLQSETCLQRMREHVPTGCSPRDSGRLLAVDLNLFIISNCSPTALLFRSLSRSAAR